MLTLFLFVQWVLMVFQLWWPCCAPLMIMLASVSVLYTFYHLFLTCSSFYDPPPMLYIPFNIFDPPASSKTCSFLFGQGFADNLLSSIIGGLSFSPLPFPSLPLPSLLSCPFYGPIGRCCWSSFALVLLLVMQYECIYPYYCPILNYFEYCINFLFPWQLQIALDSSL